MKGILQFISLSSVVGAKFILGHENSALTDSNAKAPNFRKLAADDCNFSVELLHLQDASSSYDKSWSKIPPQLDTISTELKVLYPGSRIGVGFYIDKPQTPDREDFCYRAGVPIGANSEAIKKAFKSVYPEGGADAAENSLGAAIRAALSPKSGFTEKSTDDKKVVKVLTIAVDGLPQFIPWRTRADTIKQWIGTSQEQNALVNWPTVNLTFSDLIKEPAILADDENYGCEFVEYPRFVEFKTALTQAGIIPVILTSDWSYMVDGKKWIPEEYYRLGVSWGYTNWTNFDTGLEAFWQSMMTHAGVDGVVARVKTDMSDMALQVKAAVADISKSVCSR